MEHYEYNGVLKPETVILFKAVLPIPLKRGYILIKERQARRGEGGGAGVGGGGVGGGGGMLLKKSHVSVPALPLGAGLPFGFHANNRFDWQRWMMSSLNRSSGVKRSSIPPTPSTTLPQLHYIANSFSLLMINKCQLHMH